MIFILLPIAASTVYLGSWRVGVRRRNAQSWDALLARLRPEWSARALSDRSLWKEGLCATPEDIWQRMEGPRGLCVMYQNAGVMMEMADYAARNCRSVDRELLAAFTRDVMHIRVCVLIALGQYAFGQVNESISAHAFHAASIYVDMAARMTQLLQDRAAAIVPDFVAAL
ncbi:MAG: hypothetical protein P4K94_01850 [Terracidiphilus sp.]|nr:hypothetical protein [Terracidiphilus sp.]